jgi:glutamyl-tRNA synthetase
MTVRVRFAPSPTGKLHVGNIRTALANVLFSKHHGGSFVLRMEDTDVQREVKDAEKNMFADLEWLGLSPDESPEVGGNYAPYRMSERSERGDYENVIKHLLEIGRAYECFVSKDELALMRKIQRAAGKPPHYDGRHRNLSDEEKQAFRDEGRKPVIRFKFNDDETAKFKDLIRGDVAFEVKNLGGDPVIVRDNGVPLFTLAGVVDDINQKISHAIRGEDHVTNTAVQVQIFEALGAEVPIFAHMPMLTDIDGTKLSKRLDGLSIRELREAGYLPAAINSYLASLGFSTGVQLGTVEELAKAFDLGKMGRAPVRFDIDQLKRANAGVLHETSYTEIKPYLEGFLPKHNIAEEKMDSFWQAASKNIEVLTDLKEHFDICFGECEGRLLEKEDAAYIEQAAETLPHEPYTAETWPQWMNTLKEVSGRKGKALFMPLRVALTGQQHGPELANLLPIIGEEAARKRLQHALKR